MKPSYYKLLALYFFVCLPLSSVFANEDGLFAKIRTAKGSDFIINIYAAIPYFDSLPIPQKQAAFVRYESCIANAAHPYAFFYAKYINGYAYRSTKKDNLFTLKIYLELLKIAQDKKEDFLIYFALRAVGLAYTDLGSYSEAYEYIQQAIALDEQNNNRFMLSNEVFEIGDYFLATKDYLKAISFYRKGLRMPENPNQFYKMLYTDMIGVSLGLLPHWQYRKGDRTFSSKKP